MKASPLPTVTGSASLSRIEAALPVFEHHPLTRLVAGPGTLSRLGELARELGGTRVLLVTDPGLEAAGHPRRALNSLHGAGLEAFVFDGVEENPTTRHVADGLAVARARQIDLLVAVGGGSSMDCAKGINFLYTNGGRMSDYKGHGKATKPMLPSIGVPTTSGTGSEAQSFALIADERTHMKMACGDRKVAFKVSILDPDLTESQPSGVAAVTGIDAMTHAIESYVSTKRNPLSQMYAREGWRLLEGNLETVLRTPSDAGARSAMQLGSHFAGVAIENAMLGAAHACANPLTAHYGLTHGIAVGILMPHVLRFNAAVVGPLYGDLVHDVGLVNGDPSAAAEVLARRMRSFLEFAELPTRLSACDVSRGILHLLAEEASQQWTGKFNPRQVSEDDLLALFEAAW